MIEHNEGNSPTQQFTTVVFETEDEYVRFTDFVYERFGGQGLDFTDVPVRYSVCVTPELLAQTAKGFAMRRVTEADITQALNHVKGQRPFDPQDLELE